MLLQFLIILTSTGILILPFQNKTWKADLFMVSLLCFVHLDFLHSLFLYFPSYVVINKVNTVTTLLIGPCQQRTHPLNRSTTTVTWCGGTRGVSGWLTPTVTWWQTSRSSPPSCTPRTTTTWRTLWCRWAALHLVCDCIRASATVNLSSGYFFFSSGNHWRHWQEWGWTHRPAGVHWWVAEDTVHFLAVSQLRVYSLQSLYLKASWGM